MTTSKPVDFDGNRPTCPVCRGTRVIRGESYGRDLWAWYECPVCCREKKQEGAETK